MTLRYQARTRFNWGSIPRVDLQCSDRSPPLRIEPRSILAGGRSVLLEGGWWSGYSWDFVAGDAGFEIVRGRRAERPQHVIQLLGHGGTMGRCEIDHWNGHRFFWAGAPLQLELRNSWRLFYKGVRLRRGERLWLESNYPQWQRRSVLDLVVHDPLVATLPLVAFVVVAQFMEGF